MWKKILLLSLSLILLLSGVLAVSAEEQAGAFEFEEVDARNMFAGQVIRIPTKATTLPKIDGVVGADEYTVNTEIANYQDETMTAKLSLSYCDGFLYGAVQRKADALYEIQIDVNNASTPHPYSTVDRTNNRISEAGAIKN